MSNELIPSLLLMFMMGFMGSLHCIGMCGGLITAVSVSTQRVWWAGLLVYQLGRVSTYAILGFLIGLTGLALGELGGAMIQRLIAMLAGFIMVIFALNLAGWLPDPLQRLSLWAMRSIGLMQMVGKMASHARLHGWYTLGLVNGLLPCGLVYAALAMGLASGHAINSSLMMASFGLGTIPAMMLVPSLLQKMSPTSRLRSMRIAAFLMLLLALMTIFRAFMPMHGM